MQALPDKMILIYRASLLLLASADENRKKLFRKKIIDKKLVSASGTQRLLFTKRRPHGRHWANQRSFPLMAQVIEVHEECKGVWWGERKRFQDSNTALSIAQNLRALKL